MEVDFAFLADAAEAVSGKLYVMGGVFDTIWVPDAPALHPHLSLVMRIIFTPAETGRTHKLEVNIMDADGKRLGTIGGELQVGPSRAFGSVMNFGNLKFDRFGDYSFEIIVNNTSLKSVPFRVAQRIPVQS